MYSKDLGPRDVKKEDLKAYISRYNTYTGLVFIFLSIIPPFITFLTGSHLTELYNSLGLQLGFMSKNAFLMSLIVSSAPVFLGLKIMFRGTMFLDQDKDYINAKFGDMLDANKYAPKFLEAIAFIYLGVAVGSLVTSVIIPIYNLSSKL